jgi:hypothetical protein
LANLLHFCVKLKFHMITRISADYFTALAKQYDDPQYFTCDPVVFPRHFFELHGSGKAELQDIEIAGVISAHLAWGRRAMIVRDCTRAFDEMGWSPYGLCDVRKVPQ